MSNLYGAFVATSNQPRFIYERADRAGAEAKLASVNHVVHDPNDAIRALAQKNIKHTEYVLLGQYVGPDCEQVLRNRARRLRTASKPQTESGFASSTPKSKSKPKPSTLRSGPARSLPKSVRR